ncbi:MAG: MBL fold metallo-hydrolase [Burkholderiales bacterium]|nr:MBL fold metallo-hydrolase [Burkholderiales bacterium]MDQ3197476.1 MBL fold metallo-hydrolase [Pseudomonadota bacterium]
MYRLLSNCRLLTATVAFALTSAAYASCGDKGIALQVLGSGGPELTAGRASSSYLVWVDGKARALVDMGGGAALRFGESGALVGDLDIALFSHLHVDHSSDFPALIKASFFGDRKRELPVYGPPGNQVMPATSAFVAGLFAEPGGVYRYLSAFMSDKGAYRITANNVTLKDDEAREIAQNERLKIFAARVIHGPIPALGFRVEAGGKSIVFSGDMNGEGASFAQLAQGADILVAHNAVPEGAEGVERKLHMPPSVIGQIAGSAKVGQLVLSHRMQRTLGKEAETLAAIKQHYRGKVSFADDMACYPLAGP